MAPLQEEGHSCTATSALAAKSLTVQPVADELEPPRGSQPHRRACQGQHIRSVGAMMSSPSVQRNSVHQSLHPPRTLSPVCSSLRQTIVPSSRPLILTNQHHHQQCTLSECPRRAAWRGSRPRRPWPRGGATRRTRARSAASRRRPRSRPCRRGPRPCAARAPCGPPAP